MERFNKLHFGPELNHVHGEESHNNDAENKHVLRRPFHVGRDGGDVVAVVAASATVLDSEPQSVDNVNDEQCGEACGSNQCVPVSAQEAANGIVGGRPEDSHSIHQHVKSNE